MTIFSPYSSSKLPSFIVVAPLPCKGWHTLEKEKEKREAFIVLRGRPVVALPFSRLISFLSSLE